MNGETIILFIIVIFLLLLVFGVYGFITSIKFIDLEEYERKVNHRGTIKEMIKRRTHR
jgi:hypothetical protein